MKTSKGPYAKGPKLEAVTCGTEVADYLDGLAKELGRKPRVYVTGYKERSKEEIERLMGQADVAVDAAAWALLDDPSRYEWINK
jgi:hypothetical protein